MNCHLCGKDLGPTAFVVGDGDFCGPAHRRQYHERARKGLEQIVDLTPESVPTADSFRYAGLAPEPLALPLGKTANLWYRTADGVRRPTLSVAADTFEISREMLAQLPAEEAKEAPERRSDVTGTILPFILPWVPVNQPEEQAGDARAEMRRRLADIRSELGRRRHARLRYATG